MKTFLRLALALSATSVCAEPVLHIDTSNLTPKTTFKVTFDQDVVKPEQVGTSTENLILNITPDLEGKIKWIEPSVALFERSGVPQIATEYKFAIAEGLNHLDGSAIPAGNLRSLRTEPFVYTYGYWRGTTRNPRYFVRFNDEVDPTAVASFLHFEDKEGNKVAAKAVRGVYGDLGSVRAAGPTWKQYFEGWTVPTQAQTKDDIEIPASIAVTPVHPLPPGESWKLVIGAGFPNASATGKLSKMVHRWVGSVRAFSVASIRAVTQLDGPRYVAIALTKPMPADVTEALLKEAISIKPAPADMKLIAKGSVITVTGDFKPQADWDVTVKRGLFALDGLAMGESKSEKIKFQHLAPILAAPSSDQAQLSKGSRAYTIETANVASARIRVKRLNGPNAIRALQGYRHYTGDGPNREWFRDKHTLPWSLVAGKTIYDEVRTLDNALDTSRQITLNWDEVIGTKRPHGLLFVSIEGEPKEGLPREFNQKKVTQAIVQLTDIGLAWKLTASEAFVYAYSCDTGLPLANVSLDTFGEDAEALQAAQTNDTGVARLPRGDKQRHLRASLDGDTVVVKFDKSMPTVSMWRFPVRTTWNPELPNRRTAFLFTDRNLYRPGETVHLKGIVRRLDGNRSVMETGGGAQLVIRDSASRVLFEQDLTLSAQGSFDHSFELPQQTVGFFNVQLLWPDDIVEAEAKEDWRERAAIMNNARFTHSFNVQEFRRNAFEVESTFVENDDPDTLKLELIGKYYQGQPVGDAKVKWFYRSTKTGFYPEDYRDYLFADHRRYDAYYWSHYFGYSEDDYYGSVRHSQNGTATLDADGFASIDFKLNEVEFPSPRKISITTEVTDLRNQMISARAGTTIHSSDTYVGITRVDRISRVGEDLTLKAVAVSKEGKPSPESLSATLKIEREVNEQIKTKTASGVIAVRNERRIELVEERPLTITAEQSKEGGIHIPIVPANPGKHIVTISGEDNAGNAIRTSVTRYVYGAKDYPWAYESGMKIKLVPEKKRYKPGETARILVLSPIEGTALVTFEREGVLRHFIQELKAENPVLEVPVTDDDAPNAFLSVLIIKGSQDNTREHKQPILRLGYCELTVDNTRERLNITMKIPGDYHRPGDEVAIDGLIRDGQGRPVSGAEVTLYAEDEGTLAVAGYTNPDPIAHFYAPRNLLTTAGTSLGAILSENPEERYSYNKGFFVGGGGGERNGDGAEIDLRTDFNPCAIWLPALVTDEQGRFEARFDTPDTLTRYRVIAVAHGGSANFGSETSEFLVKKPLMLEPGTPRFAHEGDRLQPKVVVQNATAYAGTWQVSLQVGSLTQFVEGEDKTQTRTITIPGNSNAAVSFDLRFVNTGTVDWKWSARPSSIDGLALTPDLSGKLSDAVATTFDVEYPMPLLSETHFIRFQEPSARRDMLEGLSKELLDGRGDLKLEFGRSVLLEAGGAIDFLLKYPYGCVEQTTSSTIPWIAAKNMRNVAPALRKKTEKEILKGIQAGANRLISMQTDDGGLSYWPGGKNSTDWASAYGGMAILLCKQAGADVPESVATGLQKYLTDYLRGVATEKDPWQLEIACRGCYTLALSGKPAVAYHNKLVERAAEMSPNALNFLALAVNLSGTDDSAETAKRLLGMTGRTTDDSGHFIRTRPRAAARLLALTNITPHSVETDKAIDRILQTRGRNGHWGTTWGNAWTLYALGEYAQKVETQSAPPVIQFATDEGSREIRLDDKNPSESVTIPLHGGLLASASATEGAFARVKLSAKPKIAPIQSVSKNGLQIARTYNLVKADGSSEILAQPKVGDLVRVDLQVTMPRDGTRYIVIDDPLPSLFEAVNTEFASQAGRIAKKRQRWSISHQELRDDRAVFFLNYIPRGGSSTFSYYARVTSSGEAVAPPAKVEAMYDPEFFALSPSRSFKTPNPLPTAMR